jgi:hypothetical protein
MLCLLLSRKKRLTKRTEKERPDVTAVSALRRAIAEVKQH